MSFEPYYQSGPVTLYHGDCIEVMRGLPESSVHSVVTDPPYGLGFMGNGWDTIGPIPFQNWSKAWATEAFRVLVPGGYLLAFGGTRTWHRLMSAVEDAGFEIRDSIAWLHGQGFPKSGANLKPSFEPIVVARKRPSAPGTGLYNVDACRIPLDPTEDADALIARSGGVRGFADEFVGGKSRGAPPMKIADGRWPTNVALDDTQAEVLDEQSGYQKDGRAVNRNKDTSELAGMWGFRNQGEDRGFGGGGGASRYFPIFRFEAKAHRTERPSVDGVSHPTVKPLALMQWLIRLVTPAGGTVLEPFAGSGTTAEACMRESVNCIAIEREESYLPLILQRLSKPHEQTLDLGETA